ncbi:MAG TPA: DUF2461 domain-containing protein [bacterium]|nr:DUF2461 domain-containing protein [bacterium]
MAKSASAEQFFSSDLFKFLKDLAKHNNREWFAANKARYEAVVRDPALRFIAHFAVVLPSVAPGFVADPRASGGSLFRIYRDTRFSKDKTPYKTHIGMQFRHRFAGRDAHAPCFYFHLEPKECFIAAGLWHPDPIALAKVRNAIAAAPKAWKKARKGFVLDGDVLKRPPKGFDPKHPCIADIKRKDFLTWIPMQDAHVCRDDVLKEVANACRRMKRLVDFLTRALDLS